MIIHILTTVVVVPIAKISVTERSGSPNSNEVAEVSNSSKLKPATTGVTSDGL